VASLSATNAWTVGYWDDGFGYHSLIERWNGRKWRAVASADPGLVDTVLTSVAAVSPTDVWAAGWQNDGSAYHTLIEHWDGATWSAVPSDDAGAGINLLHDVAFSAANDGWAVGESYVGSQGYDTLIEHWDGTSWSIVQSPNVDGAKDRLRAVATLPSTGQAWAVGSHDKSPLIQSYCPGAIGSATRAAPVVRRRLETASPEARPVSAGRAAMAAVEPEATYATAASMTEGTAVTAIDATAAAGVAQTDLSFGAPVAADYNNDGWTDFVYGRHFHPAGLYTNNADGTFTQSFVFPLIDRHQCSWGDVNRDGLLDLFCATGSDSGTDIKADELWIQQLDHTFVDEAAQYGVLDPIARGRRGVFVDVNHDGYPDLWLGSETERPDGLPGPNRLLINVGGAAFLDAAQYGLDQETMGGCGQAVDFNNDGYQDLLTCSSSGLRLYRNDDGTSLTDVRASLNLPRNLSHPTMVDLNGDGRLDLAAVGRDLAVYLQQPDGSFALAYRRSGFTDAVWITPADVNGDQRPDLYVVQKLSGGLNAPDVMLLNDGTGTNYTEMAVPEVTAGAGDAAYPIDYDNNGLMDILVTNGGTTTIEGPLQLIAFYPSGSSGGSIIGRSKE
jgi:hypothetical protein